MADFCKNCSIQLFGKDFGDLAGLIKEEDVKKGLGAEVLCEGCGGYILVDDKGQRISKEVV